MVIESRSTICGLVLIPSVAFRAPATGEYRLMISNVTFRGGPSYVYRATVSTAPLVQFAFPAGGQTGTTRDIAFFDAVRFGDTAKCDRPRGVSGSRR